MNIEIQGKLKPSARARIAAVVAVACAAIALVTAAPAQATVYTFDWSGVLDGNSRLSGIFNTDDTGIFGMGDAAVLIGQAITVSVRVDTGTPGAILDNSDPYSTLYGYGSGTPIGASITINGITFALDADHIGGARPVSTVPPGIVMGDVYSGYDVYSEGFTAESGYPPHPDGTATPAAIGHTYYRLANTNFYTPESALLASDAVEYRLILDARGLPVELTDGNSLTAPPSGTWALDPDYFAGGFFSIYDSHEGADGSYVRDLATASFLLNSLTIHSDTELPASVPEPATSGLMLAGLMALVVGARRRRASDACSPGARSAASRRSPMLFVQRLRERSLQARARVDGKSMPEMLRVRWPVLAAYSIALATFIAPPAQAAMFAAGDFSSYSQDDWGNAVGPAGILLAQHYDAVYAASGGFIEYGVTGNPDRFTIAFTSFGKVLTYLPDHGAPAALASSYTDSPFTASGEFGANLLALKLNMDFADAGFLASPTGTRFRDLVIGQDTTGLAALASASLLDSSFYGLTIGQFFTQACTVLGGDAPYSSAFNQTAALLNLSFVDGAPSETAQRQLSFSRTVAVPEPTSFSVVLLGLVLVGVVRFMMGGSAY